MIIQGFCFNRERCISAYLLAPLLEHVLLFLGHNFPLLAAQHHPLCARDVLHVHHQLGAVQGISVPAGAKAHRCIGEVPRQHLNVVVLRTSCPNSCRVPNVKVLY